MQQLHLETGFRYEIIEILKIQIVILIFILFSPMKPVAEIHSASWLMTQSFFPRRDTRREIQS